MKFLSATLQDEWEFNKRAGFTEADDVMCECMETDGVGADGDQVFTASAETIKAVFTRSVTPEELCSGIATG